MDNILMTNMHDKSLGKYKDLSLSRVILQPDIISFAEFVEEILSYYNSHKEGKNDDFLNRIDFSIDEGTIAKYELPFDNFNITLYRNSIEIDTREYTSNYSYTEFEYHRNFWIDLYYYKEDYNSDKVVKDIIRELNNFINRDFEKYLTEI